MPRQFTEDEQRQLADYVTDQIPQAFESYNWEARGPHQIQDGLAADDGTIEVSVERRARVTLTREDIAEALGEEYEPEDDNSEGNLQR